jgi:hypothetical protein
MHKLKFVNCAVCLLWCAYIICCRVASGGILAVPCLLTSRLKIGNVLCAMESLCGTCELSVQMIRHILGRLRGIHFIFYLLFSYSDVALNWLRDRSPKNSTAPAVFNEQNCIWILILTISLMHKGSKFWASWWVVLKHTVYESTTCLLFLKLTAFLAYFA